MRRSVPPGGFGISLPPPSFTEGLFHAPDSPLLAVLRGQSMAVRLGINPITWTNDDLPSLGGDTPLEVCLSETRIAGFSGTEMGGKFPRKSAELAPILARHRLDL